MSFGGAPKQMAVKRKRRRLSKGKQCGKSWQAMGKQAGKQANDEQTSKAKQGKASKQASKQACMSSVAPHPISHPIPRLQPATRIFISRWRSLLGGYRGCCCEESNATPRRLRRSLLSAADKQSQELGEGMSAESKQTPNIVSGHET